jgi:sporulation protein YabP
MLGSEQERTHTFYSKNREGVRIEGVDDVISFDENGVSLQTKCGGMAVEGEDLHVRTLNTGDGIVEIDGKINGVYYYENKPLQKRSLFGRRES